MFANYNVCNVTQQWGIYQEIIHFYLSVKERIASCIPGAVAGTSTLNVRTNNREQVLI
jgi:hypothetical protein